VKFDPSTLGGAAMIAIAIFASGHYHGRSQAHYQIALSQGEVVRLDRVTGELVRCTYAPKPDEIIALDPDRQDKIEKAKAAGYSVGEIKAYYDDEAKKARDAGTSEADVKAKYGYTYVRHTVVPFKCRD
jgi:hypothetical protein